MSLSCRCDVAVMSLSCRCDVDFLLAVNCYEIGSIDDHTIITLAVWRDGGMQLSFLMVVCVLLLFCCCRARRRNIDKISERNRLYRPVVKISLAVVKTL